MNRDARIFVAGHRGLVGGALVRALQRHGHANLLLRSHGELDLLNQAAVCDFFATERPEYVFMAAGRVGGIGANAKAPASFIHDNLLMALNVTDFAWKNGCKKLLFLGSSCIYPKMSPQPIKEDALLSGPLEPTNDAYALAKISGIRMARAYREEHGFDAISAMPCNLFGEEDNFHRENSHVVPALVRRFYEAREANLPEVRIWGSGTPMREFLHVDDMAEACLFLMDHYSGDEHVNVGSGKEISIRDLAGMIAEILDYRGKITTDASRPDGTPRKLLDNGKIFALGWRPQISLREGLERVCAWYVENRRKNAVLRD